MWCVGADWCDFISYDPRFSGDLKMKVIRVTATDYSEMYKDISERVTEASNMIARAIEEISVK